MINDLGTLPADLRDTLQAELSHGERVTFCTQPNATRGTRAGKYIATTVAIAVGAALALPAIARISDADFSWMLPAIPMIAMFAIVFCIVFCLAFAQHHRMLKSTAYAVTDSRAIILRKRSKTTHVESFSPTQLGHITKTVKSDGSGSLLFGAQLGPAGRPGVCLPVGFLALADVKSAETAIQKLLADTAHSPQPTK